jgi:hypothetical protein
MSTKTLGRIVPLVLFTFACAHIPVIASPTIPSFVTLPPSATLTPDIAPLILDTPTSLPTDVPSATAVPVTPTTAIVESLNATVTADLLSCRYGPGSEYLFLYGLRKGANIKLIGQTGGNNWVWVDGKNKCWINAKFVEIAGDPKTLPIVYPDSAPLPRSPYYPPTTVTKVTREGNTITVWWLEVPVKPGDYEDENMFTYIVEVWRCEAGQVIFDPLAVNEAKITFVDEPGCAVSSHGRIFVQEKHGFAGPAEIPWP